MWIELAVLGMFTGFLSGMFGIGGGTFIVPILMVLGVDIKTAIGISVTQMVMTSIFGSYLNFKNEIHAIKPGLLLGIGGLAGAAFSGYIVTHFPDIVLKCLFLGLVLFAIARFFISTPPPPHREEPQHAPWKLISLGAGTGLFAISLGVGGALILNPILASFLHYSLKRTVALSLFFVIFSSVSGFFSLAWYGHVDYVKGIWIGACSLLGVFIGIRTVRILKPKRHRELMIGLYFTILFIMLYNLS